jgi:dihydrolipoamide dehydrogenase
MVVGQTGELVDVLVVGGGPGGYSAAIRAAQLGRSVTLVERSRVGGVCLNEGCIPSKALLSASKLYRQIQAAAVLGIDAEPLLDFARLQQWKAGVVDKLSLGVTQLLDRYKVKVKTGTAYFASEHRVSVERAEEFEFLDFSAAIIATGSRTADVEGLLLDGASVLTPEQALALDHLPGSCAIVGATYIALELATAFARLGSAVTLVAEEQQMLSDLEPALAQAVSHGLRNLGVEFRLGQRAGGYHKGKLQLAGGDGKAQTVAAEIVVIAGGRAPNSDGLGLEEAGVHLAEDGRIVVDSCCRTSARSIYAAGDVVPGPLMADRAIAQGRVAAEAICGLPAAFDPSAVPLVYFTEPELMSAGLTEAAAREAGYTVMSARFPFAASGRAATLTEQQGGLQVIAESGSQRVLGIHAAGPHASELAGEATLAIEMGATLQDLALTIHPHPTLSEAIPEAAWLALDMPLHVFRSR